VIAEIQCLPDPAGPPGRPYAHIDAAIGVIRASGLDHEVGALGTTVQGEPALVWDVLRRAHDACLDSGATGVMTVLKVLQRTDGEPEMSELVGPHR
jgi:uncharacterized protein YqgV (UPF0045/DUF77 family)